MKRRYKAGTGRRVPGGGPKRPDREAAGSEADTGPERGWGAADKKREEKKERSGTRRGRNGVAWLKCVNALAVHAATLCQRAHSYLTEACSLEVCSVSRGR